MPTKAIVLDIEGTVCPITFVHDILFPFALKKAHELIPTLSFPLDAGRSELEQHLTAFPQDTLQSSQTLLRHINDLTEADVKAPYLKSLQGYLWRSGYELGEIKAPLYSDVLPAFKKWTADGIKLFIYSSGSVAAQKLLFKYTESGNLLSYLDGYFDTVNAGQKTTSAAYTKICTEIEVEPSEITFYSDNTRELKAAREININAVWVRRPGNPGADETYVPAEWIESFN